MRDRLDELIDQYPSARKLAESCFRHGVERSMRGVVPFFWPDFILSAIQPAPAEEKHGVDFSSWSGYLDRRHGQRRKPGNWPTNYVHFIRTDLNSLPIYQVNPHGAWYEDRRSGEDRRKS